MLYGLELDWNLLAKAEIISLSFILPHSIVSNLNTEISFCQVKVNIAMNSSPPQQQLGLYSPCVSDSGIDMMLLCLLHIYIHLLFVQRFTQSN